MGSLIYKKIYDEKNTQLDVCVFLFWVYNFSSQHVSMRFVIEAQHLCVHLFHLEGNAFVAACFWTLEDDASFVLRWAASTPGNIVTPTPWRSKRKRRVEGSQVHWKWELGSITSMRSITSYKQIGPPLTAPSSRPARDDDMVKHKRTARGCVVWFRSVCWIVRTQLLDQQVVSIIFLFCICFHCLWTVWFGQGTPYSGLDGPWLYVCRWIAYI